MERLPREPTGAEDEGGAHGVTLSATGRAALVDPRLAVEERLAAGRGDAGVEALERREAEYVARLARYLDEKMRAAAESTPSSDGVRVAVLAALNVVDELFRCREPAY